MEYKVFTCCLPCMPNFNKNSEANCLTEKGLQTGRKYQAQVTVTKMKISGSRSFNGSPEMSDKDEDMPHQSVLSTFRAKEEDFEKKKMAIKERVEAQLGRVESETKRLAEIRKELESLQDPMRKEVTLLRKRIDTLNKDLKPMGIACQKKEKEYREVLDAFNEKSKEKAQLVAKLMEMLGESEKLRSRKLEELSKHIESLH